MPVDYSEVMKDLECREAQLVMELSTVRGAKPAIKLLMDAQAAQLALTAPKGKYVGLGTTAALRNLYSTTTDLLSREEIFARLKEGGWNSDAKDPMSSLSATLSQMVGGNELEKVEDRWRKVTIKISGEAAQRAQDALQNAYRSAGAPNSFVETLQSSSPNAW